MWRKRGDRFRAGRRSASKLATDAMLERARSNAALIANIVHESRSLYSDEAIARPSDMDGVVVPNRYRNYDTGIPNPATFILLEGERLTTRATAIRMYSDFPFKNRHGRCACAWAASDGSHFGR